MGGDGVPCGGEFLEGLDGERKIPRGDVVPIDHIAHHGEPSFIVITVEIVES